MSNSDEVYKEVLNEIVKINNEWAKRFIAGRKRKISKIIKSKGSYQDSLLESFDSEVRAVLAERMTVLEIGFSESGRLIDMKPKPWQHDIWGRNAVVRLQEWVNRNYSKLISGYEAKYENSKKYSRVKSSTTIRKRTIERMAWGILKNRSKGKWKRKRWYNAAKTASVADLFNEVASNIPNIVHDNIVDSIKNANKK